MNNTEHSDLNIVIVGHVDHGKSTVIGRLYADTNSLPEGKLESVKEMCRRNSKPFEYAFLLDALKDERAQGITIDTARSFFKTDKRRYVIIDAPGHIEFLKNMITGASHADAALLVIDAQEGIRENSRRHGYMLSMLGIKQIAVLINKMDLVGCDEKIYDGIVKEYGEFLSEIGITPKCFIPVSGMNGDNIASKSNNMPWYSGMTVLETLDDLKSWDSLDNLPLRIPVQDVYKFTGMGDDRRIIAGTIESGVLKTGDKIMFFPSCKKTTVASIEAFNRERPESVSSGNAVGFTVTEQIYIKRGEVVSVIGEHEPQVSTLIKASIFWLGREPMAKNKKYLLKIGANKVRAQIKEIIKVINASTLDSTEKEQIDRHEVAECIIECDNPIAFDLANEIAGLGRFVIVDRYEISGGGIITEAVYDDMADLRQKVMLRNYKWEQSSITSIERSEKYGQKSAMIIITSSETDRKKDIAKTLESKLFADGRLVYYLGIGSVIYGVDSDINSMNNQSEPEREEHIRRLAEIANILLDAGVILVVSALNITNADTELISTVISGAPIIKIWVDNNSNVFSRENFDADYTVKYDENPEKAANAVIKLLKNNGVLFK